MRKQKELDYTQLKKISVPEDFSFQTTAELEPLDEIIGQERASRAFEFGLAVKLKGYNIYMAGPSGTGKTTYACNRARKMAATESVPSDWCYVYNFQNPKKPDALCFEPGIGKIFKADMAKLVETLKRELQKAFCTDDYESKKNALMRKFDNEQEVFVKKMTGLAQECDFSIKMTNVGVSFLPMVDGKCVKEEDYDKLPDEVKDSIDEKSILVQEKINPILRELRELEKKADQELTELDNEVGMYAIGEHIKEMQDKYASYPSVVNYLAAVKKDVLENIDKFIDEESDRETDANLASLLAMGGNKPEEDVTQKYRVNLIVDHSDTKGAPVVVTYNPTYNNLIGEVEYDSEFGNLTTDFMKIKGGLLHQANGGYLIVQAQDILTLSHAWESLRRVIKTNEIDMDFIRESSSNIAVSSLKPQPIPANIKVIMVGNSYYYEMLGSYDEEFDKFFKICAEFDYEMPRIEENVRKIACFIKGFVEREKTLEFDVTAVCAVIEYSSRATGRQDKLSTRFNQLVEILGEAVTWAKMDGAAVVTKEYVKKAIYEKEQRMKLYEEKLDEMLEENVIMIDTEGREVGQINGLAVLDVGSYSFGNPTRITATTYIGESGIVNIEKEAHMSGQTHDKGVQIITGFLGQTYAQKFPLSLSCRICFEQNYSGIDGDSASSTELYCILSSLSDIPIRQDLAVTGSVNQKGEIQAIGGVTHKIEGFYDLCKKRGLTGKQGVIIPVSNIRDLVLDDEVVEAVKNGFFHIYPIAHINEGLELLLDCPAGEKDSQGEFPADSIHGRVVAKLKAFDEASKHSRGIHI